MASEVEGKNQGLVGGFIRERREQLGLSRAQLTKILGFCSSGYLGVLERGRAPFPWRDWRRYADALSVPRHEFLRLAIAEKHPDMLQYLDFKQEPEATVHEQ